MVEFIRCDECEHPIEDDDYEKMWCDHPDNDNRHYIDGYYEDGKSPAWCIRRRKQQSEMDAMKQERNFDMTDFDAKTAQVKGNAITAADTVKNVVVQHQQGLAVITLVKSALKKAPGFPEPLKALLDTAYGDLIVGLVLHTCAPVLTGSPTVIKAVKAANVAGAISLSTSFTFIKDSIEGAINGMPELQEMFGKAEAIMNESPKTEEPPVRETGHGA